MDSSRRGLYRLPVSREHSICCLTDPSVPGVFFSFMFFCFSIQILSCLTEKKRSRPTFVNTVPSLLMLDPEDDIVGELKDKAQRSGNYCENSRVSAWPRRRRNVWARGPSTGFLFFLLTLYSGWMAQISTLKSCSSILPLSSGTCFFMDSIAGQLPQRGGGRSRRGEGCDKSEKQSLLTFLTEEGVLNTVAQSD